MKEYQSLSHTRWDCKYHVVFIPKRRKKAIFGALRKHLGLVPFWVEVFRELARHKEAEVVEGHLMPDHRNHREGDNEVTMSRAHVFEHSAEGRGIKRSRVHEGRLSPVRQERDHHCAEVHGPSTEF